MEDPGGDEVTRAAGKIVMREVEQWPPPDRFGPHNGDMLDRFANLPRDTRELIAGWRKEERDALDELVRTFRDPDKRKLLLEAIRMVQSTQTVGRFGKWFVVTVVATFIAAISLGEKIGVAWKWLTAR